MDDICTLEECMAQMDSVFANARVKMIEWLRSLGADSAEVTKWCERYDKQTASVRRSVAEHIGADASEIRTVH